MMTHARSFICRAAAGLLIGLPLLVAPDTGRAQAGPADAERQRLIEANFAAERRAVAQLDYAEAVEILDRTLELAQRRNSQGQADADATARAKAELEFLRTPIRERVDYLRVEANAIINRGSHDPLRAARETADALNTPLDQLEYDVVDLNTVANLVAQCRTSLAAYPVFEQLARYPGELTRVHAQRSIAVSDTIDALDAACAAVTAAEAQGRLDEAEARRKGLQRQCDALSSWAKLRTGNALTPACYGHQTWLRPIKAYQSKAEQYAQALDRFAQAHDTLEQELAQRLSQAAADQQRLEALSRDIDSLVYAYDRTFQLRVEEPRSQDFLPYAGASDLLRAWAGEQQQARDVLLAFRKQDVAFDRTVLNAGNALAAQTEAALLLIEDSIAGADWQLDACQRLLPELAGKFAAAANCVQQAAARESAAASTAVTAATPGTAAGRPTVTPPPPAPGSPTNVTPAPGSAPTDAESPGSGDVFGGLEIRGAPAALSVGGTAQLVATDKAGRPYPSVRWTSFEPDVLQVHGDGSLLGLKAGTVTVQATIGAGLDARVEAITITVADAAPSETPSATTASPGNAPPADVRTQDPTSGQDAPGEGFSAGSTVEGPAAAADTGAGTAPTPAATGDDRTPEAPSTGSGFTDLGTTSGGDLTLLGAGAGMSAPPPSAAPPGVPASSSPAAASGSASAASSGARAAPGAATQPVAGRPVPYHVFATGSRLGWGGGLARYSVGPADDAIITHLHAAGEHAMWANRESSAPLVAWPNWNTYKGSFDDWAGELARAPSNNLRRQIAIQANSSATALGNELAGQMAGDRLSVESCETTYLRLGYQLGYAQQVLMIADEAASQGAFDAAASERADAFTHLQVVRDLLNDYDQIRIAAGYCADLTDVRTGLEALMRLPARDHAAQARTATETWQVALERIAALAQPAQALARAPTRPAATVPGAGAAPRPPQPATPTGSASNIAGDWFQCSARSYEQPVGRPTLSTRIWLRHCLEQRNARGLRASPAARDLVLRITPTPEDYLVTVAQPYWDGVSGPPASASAVPVAHITPTGTNTYDERRGGLVREVTVDGDLMRIAQRGRPSVEYYVRRERRSNAPPTLVTIPDYGPAELPSDLRRYTSANLRFEYSGLTIERQSTSRRDPSPGNARLVYPESVVQMTEAPTGGFDGTTFTAEWQKPLGYTGFFPNTGSFGSCQIPTDAGVIRGSLRISLDVGGNRIDSLRITFDKAARPTGGFPQCTDFRNGFQLELAAIPYVRDLSTPSWLVFQFPLQPGDETACSRVRRLEGGGYSVDDTGERTWRVAGFDCSAAPGGITVWLMQPDGGN